MVSCDVCGSTWSCGSVVRRWCCCWCSGRYEFGKALYVGWGASALTVIGGSMLCCNCPSKAAGKTFPPPTQAAARPGAERVWIRNSRTHTSVCCMNTHICLLHEHTHLCTACRRCANQFLYYSMCCNTKTSHEVSKDLNQCVASSIFNKIF